MALKGKGDEVTRWHAEVDARLAQVRREMRDLAIASRVARGWRWALVIQRSVRGASQLRWRGADWGHIVWPNVLKHLNELPPAVAQWYHETQYRVLVLNFREQAIRYELRTVERLAQSLSGDTPGEAAGQRASPPSVMRYSLAQPDIIFADASEGESQS